MGRSGITSWGVAGEAGLRRVFRAGAMGSLPQATSWPANEASELRARDCVPTGSDCSHFSHFMEVGMTAEIIPFREYPRISSAFGPGLFPLKHTRRDPVFIPVIAWWPLYLWPTLVIVRL